MQRKVTEYNIKYATTVLNDDGTVPAVLHEVIVVAPNEKEAIKKARKQEGIKFNVLAVDTKDVMYQMDDETFFKYATKVE